MIKCECVCFSINPQRVEFDYLSSSPLKKKKTTKTNSCRGITATGVHHALRTNASAYHSNSSDLTAVWSSDENGLKGHEGLKGTHPSIYFARLSRRPKNIGCNFNSEQFTAKLPVR